MSAPSLVNAKREVTGITLNLDETLFPVRMRETLVVLLDIMRPRFLLAHMEDFMDATRGYYTGFNFKDSDALARAVMSGVWTYCKANPAGKDFQAQLAEELRVFGDMWCDRALKWGAETDHMTNEESAWDGDSERGLDSMASEEYGQGQNEL